MMSGQQFYQFHMPFGFVWMRTTMEGGHHTSRRTDQQTIYGNKLDETMVTIKLQSRFFRIIELQDVIFNQCTV
jgi:hypothetical protein